MSKGAWCLFHCFFHHLGKAHNIFYPVSGYWEISCSWKKAPVVRNPLILPHLRAPPPPCRQTYSLYISNISDISNFSALQTESQTDNQQTQLFWMDIPINNHPTEHQLFFLNRNIIRMSPFNWKSKSYQCTCLCIWPIKTLNVKRSWPHTLHRFDELVFLNSSIF